MHGSPMALLFLLLVALLSVPLALALAGAALAPLIRRRRPRSMTDLGYGLAALAAVVGLAALLPGPTELRALTAGCVACGVLVAVALRRRSARVEHPSVRDHGRSSAAGPLRVDAQ